MEESVPAGAFVGSWNVLEATLPDGTPAYTGTIDIRRSASVFDLDWDITAGVYVGIGLLAGSHLLVSCGEQRAGLGIALFRVQSTEVSVEWSSPELQGAAGTGQFVTGFEGSFEGDHELAQFLPGGSLYGEWTMQIRRAGDLFEIAWRKGESVHFNGLGLQVPGGMAVGWYPDVRQLAFMDYYFDPADRGHLLASWALGGFTSLGTEVLARK